MISSNVHIKRKILEKKIPSDEENVEDDLEQNDKTENESNEREIKSKESVTLSEAKKRIKRKQQTTNLENQPESNSNEENITFWRFLMNLLFWIPTLPKRLYNWFINKIAERKKDKTNKISERKNFEWKFNFLERINFHIAIPILISICCLGYVIDDVRHPKKTISYLEYYYYYYCNSTYNILRLFNISISHNEEYIAKH